MRQSPIFARTHDLLLWLIPWTTRMPREQRFVMARAVQEAALRFQEALFEAALGEEQEQPAALRRADIQLTRLRHYLRLCQDMQLMTLGQYRHVSAMVEEVGNLLGGWRKK